VLIPCPKCGFEHSATAVECPRCGIVFGRWHEGGEPPIHRTADRDVPRNPINPAPGGDGSRARARHQALPDVYDPEAVIAAPSEGLDEVVTDGRVGRSEVTIMGLGLVAAVVVYAIPFTRMVFLLLVTLFHELGHAVVGWLLACPSIPAFDFVYGGGFTHQGQFQPVLAVLIAAAIGYALWLFRHNRRSLVVISVVGLVWLILVTKEWRREIAIASAGHAFEFILAGVMFYQALANVGWRIPELERPLGAFVAFFVQINAFLFAIRLRNDAGFLDWYREGKGGALMNDLEVVALDLQIHLGITPGIRGVAGMLVVFSFVPISAALVWYFYRRRSHAILDSLLQAES
jgi:hypothetical protein